MVVFVVKRYAVREAEKWRYAVRKAKIGRYAVRQGEGGVTLIALYRMYMYICITVMYKVICNDIII